MNYLRVSDTTRVLMVPGTKAQFTLTMPYLDHKNKKHQILNPDGSFLRWLDDIERFDAHTAEVAEAANKCTGKHKKHVMRGGDGRTYPRHGECMDTARYVEQYMKLNGNKLTDNFGPLSTRTQEWPAEPVEEMNDDQ